MSSSSEKKSEKKVSAEARSNAKSGEARRAAKAQANGLGKERVEAIRAALLSKRAELSRQQATQLSELYNPDKHHLADLEEMASDTSDTDSLCAIVDLGSSTIEQIDGALGRLDDGTYGICEVCEQPINPDRLEVLPFASLCIDCQRRKELKNELASRPEEDD